MSLHALMKTAVGVRMREHVRFPIEMASGVRKVMNEKSGSGVVLLEPRVSRGESHR